MRQAIDRDVLESLESFGFSTQQARVYAELVALGPTTAGPLVKRTGLHRQYVYSALEKLEQEQFVSHVLRNGRKTFSAARPEKLLSREVERLRKMQLVVPKLQQLALNADSGSHVEVLTGRDEFIRRLFTVVDSAARCDGIVRLIADVRDQDVYALIGNDYSSYIEHQKKKKIKKHMVAPISSASELYRERFIKEPRTELRVLDSAPSTPTATVMTQELIVLDLFGEEVISVLIWSRSLARSYLEHFGVLWKAARRWKG